MANGGITIQLGKQLPNRTIWPLWGLPLLLTVPAIFVPSLTTFMFVIFLVFISIRLAFVKRKDYTDLLYFTTPLLLLVVVGLIGAFGYGAYDVGKDIWYVVSAILALSIGYLLMWDIGDLRLLFKGFVYAGMLIAVVHLSHFALHPELIELDATDVRRMAGTGYFAPALALSIFLSARYMGLRIFGKHVWISYLAIALCMLSISLSFSRIILISLGLISAAIIGWIHFNSWKKVALAGMLTAALLAIGMSVPTPRVIGAHSSLADKVLYSFQEIKIKDYSTIAEINENYRGYESERALKAYVEGNPLEYLVGKGFGYEVNLGLFMRLAGEWTHYAPVLHNGYLYLLVKTGVVGLLLYGLLLFRIIRAGVLYSRSEHMDIRYAGRLIVGLGLVFVVSTFVISGMFNKSTLIPVSVLLGALLAYSHRLQLQTRS